MFIFLCFYLHCSRIFYDYPLPWVYSLDSVPHGMSHTCACLLYMFHILAESLWLQHVCLLIVKTISETLEWDWTGSEARMMWHWDGGISTEILWQELVNSQWWSCSLYSELEECGVWERKEASRPVTRVKDSWEGLGMFQRHSLSSWDEDKQITFQGITKHTGGPYILIGVEWRYGKNGWGKCCVSKGPQPSYITFLSSSSINSAHTHLIMLALACTECAILCLVSFLSIYICSMYRCHKKKVVHTAAWHWDAYPI
jgi:hypothetical protein